MHWVGTVRICESRIFKELNPKLRQSTFLEENQSTLQTGNLKGKRDMWRTRENMLDSMDYKKKVVGKN